MIADLHESFEAETAPIYDQAMRAHNRTHTPRPRVTRRQKSPTRLRILNTAPILQAVTSNA